MQKNCGEHTSTIERDLHCKSPYVFTYFLFYAYTMPKKKKGGLGSL